MSSTHLSFLPGEDPGATLIRIRDAVVEHHVRQPDDLQSANDLIRRIHDCADVHSRGHLAGRYRTLAGREMFGGSAGTFGINIRVAGDDLPDLEQEAIFVAAERALRSVQGEIMAAKYAVDPQRQKEAALARQGILYAYHSQEKIGAIYVEEIPNGYCSDYCCRHLPWFVVTSSIGRLKIGQRKRVIQLDWSDSIVMEDALTLFPDEDVTRFDRTIHAWSEAKLRDYVAVLHGIKPPAADE